MKRFLYGLICVCIAMTVFGSQASAALINSIEVHDGITTIKGQLPQPGAGQIVSLEVLKPGKTIEGIDDANPLLALDILSQLDQTQTDADGNYEFRYKLQGDSGSYMVRVSWYALETPETKSFLYFNPADIIDLVDEINATTDAVQMSSLIVNNAQMIGLDLTNYNALSSQGKNLVTIGMVQHDDFSDIEAIADYFYLIVILQELNDITEGASYKAIIEQSKDLLGLDNSNVYKRFSVTMDAASISSVHQRVMAKKIYDPQVYKKNFEDMVIATALEKVGGWAEVYGILYEHNDILMLNFTAYNKLKEKSNVDKQLAGKFFGGREDIAKAFNKAVQDASDDEADVSVPSGPSGPSGSSGSSGGTTSSIAVVGQAAQEQPKQQTEDQFQDLDTVPWAVDSIRWLAYKGILNGKGNGFFKPDDEITREEFTKILVAAFNVADETASSSFGDVDPSHWSYRYISSASKIGLVKGDLAGNFGLGKNITRQEMTVLAYRMLTIKNITLPNKLPAMLFADGGEIADYAILAVSQMQQAGIVSGVGSGRFAPNEGATRAQAAKIVYELLGGERR